MTTPELIDRLCKYLAARRGHFGSIEESIITGGEIAQTISAATNEKYTDAQVRELVNAARKDGAPIGSNSHKPYGYFWALDADELRETNLHFMSRITDMEAARRGMFARFKPIQDKMPL